MVKSNFLRQIKERGYFNQATHEQELDDLLAQSKIAAYIGFDCTAASLHVGSLIQIMILRYLQRNGHTPIVVLGGGTTKIGDPSGKDESRQLLSDAQIEENMVGIAQTLRKFDLSIADPSLPAFKFVDNDEWLKNLNYIELLRDFGNHFSINRMLTFDSVKLRLEREQELTFLEFNYMILQAYDFYHLNKTHNCVLQIGGSDQWGNIVNGIDLTRRVKAKNKIESDRIYGLTTPLLTTSDGKKMGKTANGAVWLSASMLDPFEYFQYFRNVDDKDVSKFLKLFSELSLDEIEEIEKLNINEQKKKLAFEATKICHGLEIAKTTQEKADKIFGNKAENIDVLPELIVENGKNLVEILKDAGVCASSGEARRLIEGSSVKINDEKVSDKFYIPTFGEQKFLKLSVGKKKFFKLTQK